MVTDLPPIPTAAAAQRAFRFGAAAGLLGVDVGRLTPWMQRLGPELARHMWATVSSDLRSVCLRTRGDAADGSRLGQRLCEAALVLHQHREAAWFRHELERRAAAPPAIEASAAVSPQGLSLGLELSGAAAIGDVLARHQGGPAPRLGTAAAARLQALAGNLKDTCDAVASEDEDGQRVLRLSVVTPVSTAAAWLPPVMAEIGVTPPQCRHFAATVEPLAGAPGLLTVRLSATESGVVNAVTTAYANVPMNLVLPLWRMFRPLPDLGGKVGALVGALGAEVAAEFAICYRDQEPPDVRVTWACDPQPSAPFHR